MINSETFSLRQCLLKLPLSLSLQSAVDIDLCRFDAPAIHKSFLDAFDRIMENIDAPESINVHSASDH